MLSALSTLLSTQRQTILATWQQYLATLPDDLIGTTDAVATLLDALESDLSQATVLDINDPAFTGLSRHMALLSAQRAREGYSPSSTGRMVMGLKRALTPLLAGHAIDAPTARQADLLALDQFIDQLCFLTFEAYMQAREEVITTQSQAILEISTPALRIWDGIVLMPLVGVIDTARARHIMEHLLSAVSHQEAEIAILDVTGVPVIDTRVALHLTKVVEATRMLGADVIITGFSPEAAQTLVKLDLDLSSVDTRGTLRAGLGDALRRIGRHVAPL